MPYYTKLRYATKMTKGVWKTYFLIPLSSWSRGLGTTTGLAPVFYYPLSGDYTPRPHDCSPLEDGPLRFLSLH